MVPSNLQYMLHNGMLTSNFKSASDQDLGAVNSRKASSGGLGHKECQQNLIFISTSLVCFANEFTTVLHFRN